MKPGARVGLDDFFAAGGTVDELEQLAKDELQVPVTVDELLLEWALNQAEQPVRSAAAQHLRPDGTLVYAVPLADKLALVASDGSITLSNDVERAATRATFSAQGIRRFRLKQHLDLADVIAEVGRLLLAHVRFSEDWQPLLVSVWVVGTFLHVLFAFFGYLHITSASKRCGKSLLLDLLSYLCFNATRTATDPSPAFIFRDAERNCGTQLFDEVERLTDADRQSRAALMAMLNAGFKRGARVPRVMDAKADLFREFNVYAPRALASIRRLSSTVADRSFRIELIRKRRDEQLKKFSPRLQTGALTRLRDELHLVALEHARDIAAWYDNAEEFPIPDEVDDRLRDILEPLFAVAAVADAEKRTRLHADGMVKAAKALAGIRVEHDTDEAALVAALAALRGICESNDRGLVISAGGALSLFQETEGLEWVETKDKARGLLRRLGFRSGIHRRERFAERTRPDLARETARGYEIRGETVRDLLSRFSADAGPSQASHSYRQNNSMHLHPSVTPLASDG